MLLRRGSLPHCLGDCFSDKIASQWQVWVVTFCEIDQFVNLTGSFSFLQNLSRDVRKTHPRRCANKFYFLDYGLHAAPKNLNKAVQESIDKIEQPSLILLGYGLCDNGLNNIRSGKHTLIIPKADDCIAIFMGSRDKYLEVFSEKPGTYYLT